MGKDPHMEIAHLQEDIQLRSNVVYCSNLGLGFFDEVILLLLKLLSPLFKPVFRM